MVIESELITGTGMKNLFLLLILLTLLSCNGNKAKQTDTSIKPQTDSTAIIEVFTDSLNIGRKGSNKITLIKHRVFDELYVIIKFYTKDHGKWSIQNTYVYECNNDVSGLGPEISDFNNDNYNDLTYVSALAARSVNVVRRLFIYDTVRDELISIKNSEDFPNMLYNEELDCIDAFMFYGGTSTVFAKIKGDSLIKFAQVEISDYRTVYETNENGVERLIQKDTIADWDDVYIRYKNYKPLKEYRF